MAAWQFDVIVGRLQSLADRLAVPRRDAEVAVIRLNGAVQDQTPSQALSRTMETPEAQK